MRTLMSCLLLQVPSVGNLPLRQPPRGPNCDYILHCLLFLILTITAIHILPFHISKDFDNIQSPRYLFFTNNKPNLKARFLWAKGTAAAVRFSGTAKL